MTAAERLQAEKERLLATTGFYVPPYRMANLMKAAAKIMDINEEQTLLTYGVLACLKGLKEQGCNGPVSEAINKIEKYLNKKAHGD